MLHGESLDLKQIQLRFFGMFAGQVNLNCYMNWKFTMFKGNSSAQLLQNKGIPKFCQEPTRSLLALAALKIGTNAHYMHTIHK